MQQVRQITEHLLRVNLTKLKQFFSVETNESTLIKDFNSSCSFAKFAVVKRYYLNNQFVGGSIVACVPSAEKAEALLTLTNNPDKMGKIYFTNLADEPMTQPRC